MSRAEVLHPQDLMVACKVYSDRSKRRETSYASLAADLAISTSTAHDSVDRCRSSGLMTAWLVHPRSLCDLLVVAAPRIFYARARGEGRGMPTSVWAAGLASQFRTSELAVKPLVWPDDHEAGCVQGTQIDPIYPTVPYACRRDPLLYDLLALCDVARVGSTAERAHATSIVAKILLK
jgi:hypothetical protein